MKTLILLRHGKSDWNTSFGSDHERPVAPRGLEASRRVGKFLGAAGLDPDRILTSTALRAKTTATLAAEAGGFSAPLFEDRALYATTVEGALEVIRAQPDRSEDGQEIHRLLLVGHEPTWSSLGSYLIGGGRLAVVTATAVVIDLGISRWADIGQGRGELRLFLPPRALGGPWK